MFSVEGHEVVSTDGVRSKTEIAVDVKDVGHAQATRLKKDEKKVVPSGINLAKKHVVQWLTGSKHLSSATRVVLNILNQYYRCTRLI